MFFSKLLLLIYSGSNNLVKPAKKVFIKLNAAESGIGFNNIIAENDWLKLIGSEFAYMGGGVGILILVMSRPAMGRPIIIHQLISFIVLKIFFVKK